MLRRSASLSRIGQCSLWTTIVIAALTAFFGGVVSYFAERKLQHETSLQSQRAANYLIFTQFFGDKSRVTVAQMSDDMFESAPWDAIKILGPAEVAEVVQAFRDAAKQFRETKDDTAAKGRFDEAQKAMLQAMSKVVQTAS